MSIATEIERLQEAKADIRQALIDKGADVPSTDTIDEYAEYINGLSSGDVVNGVIKEYLASSDTIDANSFVEFVNNVGSSQSVAPSQTSIASFVVSKHRAVLFCLSLGSGYPLTAYVVSFSMDGQPSIAQPITISTSTYSPYVLLACPVGDDAGIVLWQSGNTGMTARAVLVNDDNSLTLGTATNVYRSSTSYGDDEIISMGNRKGVCSVQGLSAVFVVGEDLSTTFGTLLSVSCRGLARRDENSFMASVGSNYIALYTVSGLTITQESDSVSYHSSSPNNRKASIVLWNESDGAVAFYRYISTNTYYITLATITVADSPQGSAFPYTITITQEYVPTIGAQNTSHASSYRPVLIYRDQYLYLFFATYSANDSYKCYIFTTDCLLREEHSDIPLLPNSFVGYTPSLAVFDNVIAVFSSFNGVAVLPITTTVQLSTDIIDGLTKTEATTTTPGEVWVLGS